MTFLEDTRAAVTVCGGFMGSATVKGSGVFSELRRPGPADGIHQRDPGHHDPVLLRWSQPLTSLSSRAGEVYEFDENDTSKRYYVHGTSYVDP
jgi:hypothetical protein